MALDYAILLDPIYSSIGVAATIIPRSGPTKSVEVTVLDKTIGVAIPSPDGGSVELDTFAPSAMVRVAELTEKLVDVKNLDDGRIIMNGKFWRVKATRHRPTPDGVGEVAMILTEDGVEE